MEEERDVQVLHGLIRWYLAHMPEMTYGGVAHVCGCGVPEVEQVAREERRRQARIVAQARAIPRDPWSW